MMQPGFLCVCFRLCTEYEALHKIEMEENDFINQFMQKWGRTWRQNTFRMRDHNSCWAVLFFSDATEEFDEILQFEEILQF